MTVIARFIPYARRQRAGIGALLVLALLGVAIEVLLPWPIKLIVDHALGQRPLPDGLEWLHSLPGAVVATGMLAWLAFGVLLTFLANQVVQTVRSVLQARVGARIQVDLGREVFAKLQVLSVVYHRRSRKGDLVRRVTSDTSCVATLVLSVALPLLTSVVSLAVLFAIMWQLDRFLSIVAALVTIPMTFLISFFAPRMADRAYEHEEASSHVWSIAEQALTALPVVQAFGGESHERYRFSGAADRSQRAYLRSLATQLQFNVAINAAQAAGLGAVMLIGGLHVLQGTITVGTLIVFLSYIAALYAPLLTLAYLANTSAGAVGSARRIVDVLDAKDAVQEVSGAKPLPLRKQPGHVRLERIVFGYDKSRPVLHDIDFEARPGEMVAIVGPTGAGKTSLVSLIPRLFDPWQGTVSIDEVNVRNASLNSVRESVSLVLQESLLLPLTIADNIGYARPNATRAEIEAAARAAHAHEFIERLSHGYDTVIGERGATLSVGQRQRLTIARAFLKSAPIIILDEPTSSLDAESEHLVLEALKRLTHGRTAIVIAHRLSTVRRADRIVVLKDGRVEQAGSHDELVRDSYLYRSLQWAHLREPEAAVTL